MKVRVKEKIFHSGEYMEMSLVEFLDEQTAYKNESWYKMLSSYLSIGVPERYIIRFNSYGCEVGYPEDPFFKYV